MDTNKQLEKSLYNKRIYSARNMKSLGRIRAFVLLPIDGKDGEKYEELVGYLIKRPDLLWMFHRRPAFVSEPEVGETSKGLLCVNSKDNIYKRKSLIPKTNIKWKDAKLQYLEGITEEDIKNAAKNMTKKAAPVVKKKAVEAKDTAIDNLQSHSDSLHDMFSEFKNAYNEGRHGEEE